MSSIQRYDGLFFRVARKYLDSVKNVDTAVMIDDLTLVGGVAPLSYREPEGQQWGDKTTSKGVIEKASLKNKEFLKKKLRNGKYSEVFLSMGKEYAKALPTLVQYNVRVIFPSTGGPGPKAQALREWLKKEGNL